MRKIELLAPAKNLECGIAAVDHGADAVYIGAPCFGARVAASNSLEDIASLVEYAHQFRVKVYVTLNTVLTDEQLPQMEQLLQDVYEIGVDAVIIQDMAVLKLHRPPVVLHASTQTDNRNLQKVNFLYAAGISRVVLARELSLSDIRYIAEHTQAELEVFVHGALCVSYSGQCYISQAKTGRSANRGQCAQYCRLPYDLYDSDKSLISLGKHLLSLKDLDLSGHIRDLTEAGVTSFKIEGRLKDVDYVKNITAYYRLKIDEVIAASGSRYERASSGKTMFSFSPDPEKTFRRSSTDYFLNGRHDSLIGQETPKSTGEYIGRIISVASQHCEIETRKELHNGDGLFFMEDGRPPEGFRINKVDKNRVYFAERIDLKAGMRVFRNYDHEFNKILQGKTAVRKISADLFFVESSGGFLIRLVDEDGLEVQMAFPCEKQPVRNDTDADHYIARIAGQLSKTGNTIFEVRNVVTDISGTWFFPISVLNDWRRKIFDSLARQRMDAYSRTKPHEPFYHPYPQNELTYLGNVTNHLSMQFYQEHGVSRIRSGFEIDPLKNTPLMYTRYCLRYELDRCPRTNKENSAKPLFLRNKDTWFRLDFNCRSCEMTVTEI